MTIHERNEHMEINVSVRFEAGGDLPPLTVEDHTFAVLKIVEEHAAGAALGPAVACDYDDRMIELIFTVEASNQAEGHRKIGEVLDLVAQHAPFSIVPAETTATALEPVCA